MNLKHSVFVICVEAIIYLLSCILHDCTFKLRDNRILRCCCELRNHSFQSIDFDLTKHVLVFNVNHRWNLFEKFQISIKIKMSLLGSKSSSSNLIRKRLETVEETNTGNNTFDMTDIQ